MGNKYTKNNISIRTFNMIRVYQVNASQTNLLDIVIGFDKSST